MFIKRLEIFGFKSFKNKTVLEFDNLEITGIVGPNGCGKSNVVDALLWVMGESSPKNLRGESLSDVIFGGTTKEPPGNLAEVNLILRRGKEGFPENYKSFSELMITRRAFRDGKNEYLINQQPCLLRDIREFFMNTGAGCRGFSVIEQEAIEKLITAKPINRRFIIEEAAGITKFKNRKMESVRKLDLVHQNLQRINDILKNQESQLNQLSSQAKKAEKYKKIKKDMEARQKQIERREQEEIFFAYQNLNKEQESLKSEQTEKQNKKEAFHKQIEKETALMKKTGERIKKEQSCIEAERQTELKEKMEEISLQNRVKAFEMIENTKNKKSALEDKEKSIQADLAGGQSFFKGKSDIQALEEETAQINNHLHALRQNRKEAEINTTGVQKQLDFIEREIGFGQKERDNIQSQIQNHINTKNKTAVLLKKEKQRSVILTSSLSAVLKSSAGLETEKKTMEEEFYRCRQRTSLLRQKIEDMEKLTARFQSGNEGVSDLIQWRQGEFQSLFEKLSVDSDYSTALGVVLGRHIQALIPQEDISIEEAVQRLKNKGKGRASFLSRLPGLSVSLSLRQEMKNYPAFICFLDEKIKWSFHTQALKPFLEQTAVVSDFSSALKMKQQFPSFQFVTKEGDLITRDSFVYAGSSDRETGLLEIQTQVEKCAEELTAGETALKVKTIDLKSCEQKLQEIQSEKQNLQNESWKTSEEIISITKDLEQMEKDILRLSESRKANDQKTAGFEEEWQNLLEHKEAYRREIHELKDAIFLKESRLQVLQKEMDEYKTHYAKKTEWEKELIENRKAQESLKQEVDLLLNLAGKFKDSDKTAEHSLNIEEEVRLVQEKKKKTAERLSSFQQELEKQIYLKEKQENHIKALQEQIHQAQLDIKSLSAEWDKHELEKNHLKNKFLESYQSQIEDFVSSSDDILLSKLKEDIAHYEKQLERIGGVNFLALEDYEKLSKENFFLNEQKEDLVQSKKEIIKVMSHIDKLCKTRFSSMLEEINKRFEKIFPIVFQGDNAKARLILHEEPEDKEPGVDILVHPPGKRPQSVSLLSRGEKALTSICLIYSLFLVRPSPFCIIDEADAPLDDANIFRFLSVLREMARKSQIVAVTHNKYTMQSCQKLYGVTMDRPGISQIVSVDMKEGKTLSEDHPPEIT